MILWLSLPYIKCLAKEMHFLFFFCKSARQSLKQLHFYSIFDFVLEFEDIFVIENRLCRWFRFAQLAKGKKFRP
jgi:hypothetical protein